MKIIPQRVTIMSNLGFSRWALIPLVFHIFMFFSQVETPVRVAMAIRTIEDAGGEVAATESREDVRFYLCQSANKVFSQLEKIPNVTSLELFMSHVTDANLASLNKCSTLNEISLCDVPVSDQTVDNLCKSLKKLRSLKLSNTPTTDV